MSQVWFLYHMDLCSILVAMFVNLYHGSALYWSIAMMWRHLVMSQKYWCIANAWLMISDQVHSFLEVITFSFKDLVYRIPLASWFGGHSVTHKYRRHHVLRSQTSVIAINPKLWSENTSLDFILAYKIPAPLLHLRQEALPCSVTLIVSWQ